VWSLRCSVRRLIPSLLAATNKKLEDLVKAGSFRDDLYYRLVAAEIELPPLRERREDIPLLAQSFMRQFARENEKAVKGFTSETMDTLMNYKWPGNVRELRTAMEHAVVFCRGERITLRDLPANVRSLGGTADTGMRRLLSEGELTVKEAEKQLIQRALKECDGNRTTAAKKLGMSRRTLHRKLHTYGLESF